MKKIWEKYKLECVQVIFHEIAALFMISGVSYITSVLTGRISECVFIGALSFVGISLLIVWWAMKDIGNIKFIDMELKAKILRERVEKVDNVNKREVAKAFLESLVDELEGN